MNEPENELKHVVSEWMKKGDNDLWLAELAAKESDAPGDLISFHAQQCAEKYLKAALTALQVEFPKTHNIRELIELLRPYWSAMPFDIDEAARLTYYAVSSRYPGEWEDIPISEALQALDSAKQIKQAVNSFINSLQK